MKSLYYHKYQLKYAEVSVMFYQIDELLKNSEYDIYNNPEVSDEKIKEIAMLGKME